MDELLVLCLAIGEAGDCNAEATLTAPVPLCDEHQLEIVMLVGTNLFATALRQAKTSMVPVTLPPDERAAVIAGARPKETAPYFGGVHNTIVYFAENGDRVKIGHSTNLRQRVRSLSLQEKDVVLALQGGLTLERALHANFAKERIDSTEWFVRSPRIAAFIKGKLAELNKAPFRKARPQLVTVAPGPKPQRPTGKRMSREDWGRLAAPLYRKYAIEHGGTLPSSSVLVEILRSAYPEMQFPSSERWSRLVRATAEEVLRQDDQS